MKKIKSLASAIFAVMLLLASTVSVAAAAKADSEEQYEYPDDTDALTWDYWMTSYERIYKYHDSKSNVVNRIPGDTIWMMSSHGGNCGGLCGVYLQLFSGDSLGAGDIPTNTIRLAYADACKTGVDTIWTDIWQGFRNKGTTTFIGFTRDVYPSETDPFTNYFGYYLTQLKDTVSMAAYKAGQNSGIKGDYKIYGDGSITI